MKNILIFFFLVSIVKISFAQDGENPLPYIKHEPKYDTAPRFPGGTKMMMDYFEKNIRYPEPEKFKKIQGQVSLKFDVEKSGKVINIQLLNGVPNGPNLAKEAVRLMQNMPLWIPASKKGKTIKAEYFLSIPFQLMN